MSAGVVMHWNNLALAWEPCGDVECAFDHEGSGDRIGLEFNPAGAVRSVCVWCYTGRRHHRRDCPVVVQHEGKPDA